MWVFKFSEYFQGESSPEWIFDKTFQSHVGGQKSDPDHSD